MIKKFFAVAALFAFTLPGISTADMDSSSFRMDRDVQMQDRGDMSQATLDERAGQEEWYPTCLVYAFSDTISGVQNCSDAWYPGCMAGAVAEGVGGIQDCGL